MHYRHGLSSPRELLLPGETPRSRRHVHPSRRPFTTKLLSLGLCIFLLGSFWLYRSLLSQDSQTRRRKISEILDRPHWLLAPSDSSDDAWLRTRPSDAYCRRPDPPLVCAHGGDTDGGAAPNSEAAFRAAVQSRQECVEVDVARTRDGRLVSVHARQLGPAVEAARGKEHLWRRLESLRSRELGAVPRGLQAGDWSWEELQALPWGPGAAPSSVERALEILLGLDESEHSLAYSTSPLRQITLDLKPWVVEGEARDRDVLAVAIADLVRSFPCNRCLIWAKDDALVQTVSDLSPPTARVGFVAMNETARHRSSGQEDLGRFRRLPNVRTVALHFAMAVDEGVVRQGQARGLSVQAWTASSPRVAAAVLDAGVDAVVTDRPAMLRRGIQERAQWCQLAGGRV